MTKTIATLTAILAFGAAQAQELTPPDALVKAVTLEVVELITKDKEIKAGSRAKLISVIEAKVLPHFNFGAMTALAFSQLRPTALAVIAWKLKCGSTLASIKVITFLRSPFWIS